MNGNKQAIFPRHVMSGGCYGAKRRPAQYKLVAAQPYQIGKVGVPAGKLFDIYAGWSERFAGQQLREMLTQIALESRQVQLFSGPYRRGVCGLR